MKENKLVYFWNHLEEMILVPSFMFTTALIFVQVIMRKVFNNSLSWSEELTRYIYIWQTWLGVAYAVQTGSHLRITMIRDKLPEKGKQILEILVRIIWVGFAIFVAYQGVQAIKTVMSFGQKSSALRVPMQYCYLSIPVGMILMSVRLIEKTIRELFGKKDSAAANTEGGTEE